MTNEATMADGMNFADDATLHQVIILTRYRYMKGSSLIHLFEKCRDDLEKTYWEGHNIITSKQLHQTNLDATAKNKLGLRSSFTSSILK